MSAGLRLLALSLFVFGALAVQATAQGMRLNPPLARPGGGDVRDYALSPSGLRTVYRADQESDERFELWSVRPAPGGKVVVKINGPLVSAGDVRAFRIDPLGTRVVYAADATTPGRVELWSVRIDGGPVVRVSSSDATLGGSLEPDEFVQLTENGSHAVFLQRDNLGRHALFSAPVDASAPPQVLTPFATSTRPIRNDFRIDPSGARVVYHADASVQGVIELWSVPIDGGLVPQRLNESLAQGGIGDFEFTPDGTRIVFRATDPDDGRDALWVAETDGFGTAVRLGTSNGGVLGGFVLAQDGLRVVFAASTAEAPLVFGLYSATLEGQAPPDVLAASPATLVTAFRVGAGHAVFSALPVDGGDASLWTVPVEGGADPFPIDAALVVGGPVRDDFVLTPDGRGLAFLAERADELAVFVAPVDAAFAPLQVDTLPRAAFAAGFEFSADGARLVYLADARETGSIELLSVRSDASRPRTSLSGPLVFGGDVLDFVLAPAGQLALFRADADIDGVHGLYGAAVTGGRPPVELSAPLPAGPVQGDVLDFELVGNGRHALYRATQEEIDRLELYVIETAARARPRKLNGVLPSGGDVRRFRTSLPLARVVYVADQEADERHELYSVPLDGSAPPVKLSRPLVAGGDVADFVLSPDGAQAVYLADARADGVFELFTVPIDGLGTDIRVSGTFPPGGAVDVTSLAFTPDGLSIVYFGDQLVDEVFGVFSARLDGEEDPVAISGTMVGGGDVLVVQPAPPFRLTPDGMHVVYVADGLVDGTFELFRAPVDALHAPVRISGPMTTGGNVEPGFELTPDGARAVYLADALVNGADELFSVLLDGSAPPDRLNELLFSGGKVWRFQLVPEAARVLYLADQDVRGVVEIHSARLDGAVPAIRLNQPFGPRADIASAFEPGWPVAAVSPDGTQVVYRADRDVDELDEVYVVPLDGSAPPRELNEPYGAPLFRTSRPDVAIGSDGRSVFYRAGPHGPTAAELFRVPLDASALPARLGPGVESYRVAPDASRLVTLADPSGSGVRELWLTLLDRPRRTATTPERTATH